MDTDIKTLKTSKKLKEVRKSIPNTNLTIQTLIDNLLTEGSYLLIIILVAPFLFPVSIPGSSTPFGILIILLSISTIFNKPLYLPSIITKYELTTEMIDKFFDILYKALKYVELISKPRGKIVSNKYILKINSVITIILAFLLFLPLPIPLTDFTPGVSILLLAVSSMESDSYLMVLGYIASIITVLYFYSIGYVGIEIIMMVLRGIGIPI